MKRDLDRLAGHGHDVLVVGAGIHGAWAAWDAALRGLTVAVIDRGDFGAATSANNLRLIHGGLRYLQHLDFHRMRESIRERRILLRVAPHLVHPLACVVPTYGRGARGRLLFRLALAANDVVGWGRNRGAAPGQGIPRGRLVSAARMKEIEPAIPGRGLTGGALWYDAQVLDPERLVLAVLRSAAEQGAVVANYVAADALLEDRGRVVGVRATDRLTGESFFVRARVTVNVAGPWTDRLLAATFPGRVPALFPLTQAWNLVLGRRLPLETALGLYSPRTFRDRDRKLARGSRLLFFTPWRATTLVGTSHRPFSAGALGETMPLAEAEIADLLDEAAAAYPAAELTLDDVAYAFGGLLPGEVDGRSGDVRLLKHPVIRDHARADGIGGLVTGVGVKFTTARRVAEKLIDLAAAHVGRPVDACRTPATRLVPADVGDWTEFVAGAVARRPRSIAAGAFTRLAENHGVELDAVLALAGEQPGRLEPLADGCEVLAAEVVHAARAEMAVKLMDVVRRRTGLGKGGRPGEEAVRCAAALQADELAWSAARREAEIAEVLAAYRAFRGRGLHREMKQ